MIAKANKVQTIVILKCFTKKAQHLFTNGNKNSDNYLMQAHTCVKYDCKSLTAIGKIMTSALLQKITQSALKIEKQFSEKYS